MEVLRAAGFDLDAAGFLAVLRAGDFAVFEVVFGLAARLDGDVVVLADDLVDCFVVRLVAVFFFFVAAGVFLVRVFADVLCDFGLAVVVFVGVDFFLAVDVFADLLAVVLRVVDVVFFVAISHSQKIKGGKDSNLETDLSEKSLRSVFRFSACNTRTASC